MEILLGFGGNEGSYDALDETIEHAKKAGDDVTVAILDNPSVDDDGDAVEQEVREHLEAAGFEADIRHVSGDFGARLVEIADSEGFDRVVLGGGERSPLGKITLGEIAEFVLLNSETSVTLVR